MLRERPIGVLSLLALGVNGIVGVGIFFAPSVLASLIPGAWGASIYPLTALLLLPVAITFATLARNLPVDGGPYVWARAAFGDGAALIVGWLAVVSALLSTAAVFAGLRDHLAAPLGLESEFSRGLFVWACLGALALVAAAGLRPSAWTWDALTLIKLVPLVVLVALLGAPPARAPEAPLSLEGLPWSRALLVAVFPLQGFEIVPVLAGSARGRWSVAAATVGSLLFAAGLYAALQLVCVRAVPDLAAQTAPLVAAGERLGGSSLARVVALGTNVSALGIAFGMTVMTPRYLAALGVPNGLGSWLGQRDARGVPQRALGLVVLAVGSLASLQALSALFVLSSAAVLVQYLAGALALARLAWTRQHGLSRRSLISAALAGGAIVLLMHSVRREELAMLAVAVALGFLLWGWNRARRRPARDSAL